MSRPAPTPTTDYHFILTIQHTDGTTSTRSGIVPLTPGTPRTDVYQQTVNHYFPHQNDLTVLFFDLQPNRI